MFFSLKTWSKWKKFDWKYSRWYNEKNPGKENFKKIQESMKILTNFEEEKKEFEKIWNRRSASMKRYKKYLLGMFDSYYELYWLTFQIRDKDYSKDSDRKVRQWLKENCKDYLCNKDYGKNQRRHYHAVVAMKTSNFTWDYGWLNVRQVNLRAGPDRLMRYANKLSNHAVKIGTAKWFHPRGFKEIEKIPF